MLSRIVDYYEKLSKKQKEALEVAALDGVGRADFQDNEKDWAYYSGLKLKWSTLQNIGELKASIKTKATALTEIQKKYTHTVTLQGRRPGHLRAPQDRPRLRPVRDPAREPADPQGHPRRPAGRGEDAVRRAGERSSSSRRRPPRRSRPRCRRARSSTSSTPAPSPRSSSCAPSTSPSSTRRWRKRCSSSSSTPQKSMSIGQDVPRPAIQPIPVVSKERAAGAVEQKAKEPTPRSPRCPTIRRAISTPIRRAAEEGRQEPDVSSPKPDSGTRPPPKKSQDAEPEEPL